MIVKPYKPPPARLSRVCARSRAPQAHPNEAQNTRQNCSTSLRPLLPRIFFCPAPIPALRGYPCIKVPLCFSAPATLSRQLPSPATVTQVAARYHPCCALTPPCRLPSGSTPSSTARHLPGTL